MHNTTAVPLAERIYTGKCIVLSGLKFSINESSKNDAASHLTYNKLRIQLVTETTSKEYKTE